ncbi:MAG: hypothetical protein JKY56_24570 [Kofleriaceae bacterium]|nr:hypothetical protein [Kofleriaceae bacterium]
MNQIIRYVLGVMSNRHQIDLHAVIAMSNHWHVVVSDEHANIVEFQRDCHSSISRALNASFGEFEAVWSSSPPSRVECEEPHDLLRRIAYTMANPVKDGLVRHGHSWPGVRHAWPRKPQMIRKPKKFFRGKDAGGKWPAEVELKFTRPSGYEEYSDEELAELVTRTIAEAEEKAHQVNLEEGRHYLGRKKVLAQRRHACPASYEEHFRNSPKVACNDKWLRIEKLRQNKQWLVDYKIALGQWRDGDREVEFPFGTYLMRVVHSATCALVQS